MNKNKRPQAQKVRRNPEAQRRVLELRQGSTTSPHRSASDYRRAPKHRNRGWGDEW